MNIFQRLAGAAFVSTIFFSSSVFAQESVSAVSAEPSKNIENQKAAPSRWRTLTQTKFKLQTNDGKLADARLAYKNQNEFMSCFSQQPQRFGLTDAVVSKQRFGGDKYYCVAGKEAIERLARDKKIRLLVSGASKSSVAKLLGSGSCPATVVASTSGAGGPLEDALLGKPLGDETQQSFQKAWIDGEWVEDGDLTEDYFTYEYQNTFWTDIQDLGGFLEVNKGAACFRMCDAAFGRMLMWCGASGPAIPECFAAAATMYMACLAYCSV